MTSLVSSARLFFSQARVANQIALWRAELPDIQPHYAVKANNDPQLLRWLSASGVGFDCASVREIAEATVAGAHPSRDIIYAQPCKTVTDLQRAAAAGVPSTVVDSPEEVEKLRAARWSGDVLIRLLVPDAGSAQPFSRKFGAPLDWVPEIARALAAAGQRHTGWSFHVGSVCGDVSQYRRAIECAAAAAAAAAATTTTVDIGGGFVPDPAQFRAAAAAIRAAQPLFPRTTRWIAEPGRFFAAPAADAEVEVIGVKRRTTGPGQRVTLDESVYGIFSNIPFDGQRPRFQLLASDASHRPTTPTTLFGRTCDSADCIVEDTPMPALRVGDRLRVPAMGAYTIVSASEFNGFPQPARIYERLPQLA